MEWRAVHLVETIRVRTINTLELGSEAQSEAKALVLCMNEFLLVICGTVYLSK